MSKQKTEIEQQDAANDEGTEHMKAFKAFWDGLKDPLYWDVHISEALGFILAEQHTDEELKLFLYRLFYTMEQMGEPDRLDFIICMKAGLLKFTPVFYDMQKAVDETIFDVDALANPYTASAAPAASDFAN